MSRTLTKPAKGTATKARRRRSATREHLEQLWKTAAKVRDHFTCRFPGCAVQGRYYVEAAHLHGAGMGGNPDGSRGTTTACYVTLCANHHRGPLSVHSGHYRMAAGPGGGDGRVEFVETELHAGRRS